MLNVIHVVVLYIYTLL